MTIEPKLSRILRSPILHFALGGVVLFALAVAFDLGGLGGWRARPGSETRLDDAARADDEGAGGAACGDASDASTICVERDALLVFIQAQTRMARVEDAAAAFDSATAAVRRDWIDRFVREEALVREARALGLDSADELIRRRLVQQMEFLVEDIGEGGLAVTDAEIEAAYKARLREYRHPATFRFAHVFIRPLEGFESKAPARAKVIRDEMNRKKIPFELGYPYGDRFLYDRTYVDRSFDEVRSHFGAEFAETLEKLDPEPDRWTGPHRSKHGLHLVLLTDKQPARAQSLDEVRGALREELLREKREQALERGVAAIVAKYGVVLGRGLEKKQAAGSER